MEVLATYHAQYEDTGKEFDREPTDWAFLFSYTPLHDRPCTPHAVSHRYTAVCAGPAAFLASTASHGITSRSRTEHDVWGDPNLCRDGRRSPVAHRTVAVRQVSNPRRARAQRWMRGSAQTISTVAPTARSASAKASARSRGMPLATVTGADSTTSLASFRPRPV